MAANLLARSQKPGVHSGPEFARIRALPTRARADETHVEYYTNLFSKIGNTDKLRPIQAAALHELKCAKGLFAPIAVGGGKTLVSLLAPALLFAQRPLLIVPAALRDKTLRDIEAYDKKWWIKIPEIDTYERLSRKSGARTFLDDVPDLIILDECHRVKSPKAAVTRRLARFFGHYPSTPLVALSGTVASRSLRDYAHILAWALKERSPLPRDHSTINEWSLACDEEGDFWIPPGALTELLTEAEQNELATVALSYSFTTSKKMRAIARTAIRRRIAASEGFVNTTEDRLGTSLVVRRLAPVVRQATKDVIELVRATWEKPDGEPIVDRMAHVGILRDLAQGFYYRWTAQPPPAWRQARSEWCTFVQDAIGRFNRGATALDTEEQVADACRAGRLDSTVFDGWKAIKPLFRPVTEAVWVDPFLIDEVRAWVESTNGIVWVDSAAAGNLLSAALGIPYFSEGGLDASGDSIEDYAKSQKMACIASIQACGTGRNLQNYSNALVLAPPANGVIWEQLLGRLHRQGQQADTVEYDVLCWTEEQASAIARACEDARYVLETTGAEQKLLYADWVGWETIRN